MLFNISVKVSCIWSADGLLIPEGIMISTFLLALVSNKNDPNLRVVIDIMLALTLIITQEIFRKT